MRDPGHGSPMGPPPMRFTIKALELQIRHHWCLASYLILNHDIREIAEMGEKDLPEEFCGRMAQLVHDYLYEAKMPSPEIAQTVMNVAEDLAAGRQVSLRAGDYIAAQRFLRAEGGLRSRPRV